MLTILCIGDPHFKADNQLETDAMEQQLKKIIIDRQPDLTVVLGDTLHSNEKINLHVQKRAIDFLRTLKSVSKTLYLIIGNHDRPNNSVFMTDEHPFTSLKEWGDNVKVVDTTCLVNHNGCSIAIVPYVPVGRFEEALSIVGMKPPYNGIDCIIAHQEFKGCKMSAITSKEGDDYKLDYPFCISGHIHDFDQLQSNMVYVGTPIQHGYADRNDKTISIFTFDGPEDRKIMIKHERLMLDIQRKLNLKLTPEELLQFTLPPNTKAKIKVMAEKSILDHLMLTREVKDLISKGVKIEVCITSKGPTPIVFDQIKVKTSFKDRLLSTIKSSDPMIGQVFNHIFS